MRRNGEAGEGKLALIFWLAVFVIAVMAGYGWIPAKIKDAQLVDYTIELAQFRNSAPADRLALDIYNKARELDIPLDKKAVKVEKFRDRIRLAFSYSVEIEFPGYTYTWVFDHQIDRPLFAAL